MIRAIRPTPLQVPRAALTVHSTPICFIPAIASIVLAILAGAFGLPTASAQGTTVNTPNPPAAPSPARRVPPMPPALDTMTLNWLGVGVRPIPNIWGKQFAPFAEARFRLEERPDRGSGELGSVDASRLLLRLRLGIFWKSGLNSALGQVQGAETFGIENHGGKPSDRHLDVHQLYYDRRDLFVPALGIRAGRQELAYGDMRLIGHGDFLQTGRTFDAAKLVYDKPGMVLNGFYSHTVNFMTPQPMFYFSGIWTSFTRLLPGDLQVFALHKGSDKGVALHRNTFGADYSRPLTKVVGIDAEEVGQVGTESGRDVGASAGKLIVSEKIAPGSSVLKSLPGLTFYEEADYGSGTGTPSRGDAGTFDILFPTPHARFGQIDYETWKNMTALRLGASTHPTPKWVASLDVFSFGLITPHDFWYRANGAPMFPQQDRTKNYGTDVGREVDLDADWQANAHVHWEFVAAEFLPGSFARNVSGRSDPSTLLYVEGKYTF